MPPPSSPPAQPVIIIRRKGRKQAAGHHGGAWKVAYADFVTAMMAFFLMLWLLNTSTREQLRGIADYFAPASVTSTKSGAGGMFGGLSVDADDARISSGSRPNNNEVRPAPPKQDIAGEDEQKGSGRAKDSEEAPSKANQKEGKDVQEEGKQGETAEEQRFRQTVEAIEQTIQKSPELRDLANNLLIDRTPEGLRIQIVDRDRYSMFALGSAEPHPQSRQLLRLIGQIIGRLPNHVSVSGHTDSLPFSSASGRNNWDLSTERANSSRRELEAAGVAPERLAKIVGMADREPLKPQDSKDPSNRRISIVLLRQRGSAPQSPQRPPVESQNPASH